MRPAFAFDSFVDRTALDRRTFAAHCIPSKDLAVSLGRRTVTGLVDVDLSGKWSPSRDGGLHACSGLTNTKSRNLEISAFWGCATRSRRDRPTAGDSDLGVARVYIQLLVRSADMNHSFHTISCSIFLEYHTSAFY